MKKYTWKANRLSNLTPTVQEPVNTQRILVLWVKACNGLVWTPTDRRRSGDKCPSVGEGSRPLCLANLTFRFCYVGVCSKRRTWNRTRREKEGKAIEPSPWLSMRRSSEGFRYAKSLHSFNPTHTHTPRFVREGKDKPRRSKKKTRSQIQFCRFCWRAVRIEQTYIEIWTSLQ